MIGNARRLMTTTATLGIAILAILAAGNAARAQVPGAPTDISRPTNVNQDNLLVLYRHTVYNNYASLAFGEACNVLSQDELRALRGNIQKLAVDFRDRFAFDRAAWQAMVDAMEQRYTREKPACANNMAAKFARDVSRDIISLNR